MQLDAEYLDLLLSEPPDVVVIKRLLSAVVNLAVEDVCLDQLKGRLRTDARSALDFLFGGQSMIETYGAFIGLDVGLFRERLMQELRGESGARRFTESNRKMFAINYELWSKGG